eukprot:GHVN01047569.1.p1 GENE.GHVN01047569.1~~GHVN01047569.1.p1  ORF type:complete len:184 (+),score=5.75 GHVN01047569.1:235-786(+)
MLSIILNMLGIGGIANLNKRQFFKQALSVSSMLSSAYMGWLLLGSVVNHYSPFVVVLSESMSPGFNRGDILFITMLQEEFKAGEIVVFETNKKDIPIVHRITNVHLSAKTGETYILTKGDNNNTHDRWLYSKNAKWLKKEHIKAKVKGYIPYVGMLSIIINENPKLKMIVMLGMCFLTFTSRE